MYLLGLPNELLTKILQDNNAYRRTLERHDYYNLSMTNKQLHALVFHLLYRHLDIKLCISPDTGPSKTELFIRERLLKQPGLRSHVRDLNIECAYGSVEYGEEDMCLEILRGTPNLENLGLGYSLGSKRMIDQVVDLLCSNLHVNLTTLSLGCRLCACRLKSFFLIGGLRSLSLGFCNRSNEDNCEGDHSALNDFEPQHIGTSSVSHLFLSFWQPTLFLSKILSLPRELLKFEGCWEPREITYSPLDVSHFLLPLKDSLEVLDLTASINKYDENEPQETGGTVANFSEFTALRELKCDVDIVLPEYLEGLDAENFAERLPAQLETLAVRKIPRSISRYAHKPSNNEAMKTFNKTLAFVRSLSRAAHQGAHLSSLRSITIRESSHIPGPLNGSFLEPKLKCMKWRDNEKTAWYEQSPFPLAEVGMSLSVELVFIVRGWTVMPKDSEGVKKLERKDARRLKELEAGLNIDHDDRDQGKDLDENISDVDGRRSRRREGGR